MHDLDARSIKEQVTEFIEENNQWGGAEEEYRFEQIWEPAGSNENTLTLRVNGEYTVWKIVKNSQVFDVTLSFRVETSGGKDAYDVEDWAENFEPRYSGMGAYEIIGEMAVDVTEAPRS